MLKADASISKNRKSKAK